MPASNKIARSTAALPAFLQLLLLLTAGCSSAPKTEPELSEMKGKRVALVEVQGEASQRAMIEVALVNQLVARGTFILAAKKDVELAQAGNHRDIGTDPVNWVETARKVDAQFALRAKVLEVTADERETYAAVETEDSQLAAETGSGKTTRPVKVKSLTAKVRVEMEFIPVDPDKNELPSNVRIGIAEASRTLTEDSEHQAIHFPPKLRLLEDIANEAFKNFFERYH